MTFNEFQQSTIFEKKLLKTTGNAKGVKQDDNL